MTDKASADTSLPQTRQNKNTLWLLLFSLGFVALAAYGYLQLTRDDHLPIKQISISGVFDNVKPADVQKIMNNDIEGNFFTLDVARLYESLMALDWVKSVLIHRIWPDKLSIEMQEHVPVAIALKKGLLNAEGEVFTAIVGSYAGKLPLFSVADRYYKQAIEDYQQLTTMLSSRQLAIREFVFDERKSRILKLDNGVEIVLGRHETEQRFSRFVKAFGDELSQNKAGVKRIDLRFTNGFAVSGLGLFLNANDKEFFWA